MAELTSMMNIGKEMERKLRAVGIRTAEELAEAGGEEAFLRLKLRYPNVCLVHLYVLQGAIDNMPYNRLPSGVKERLRRFSDGLKGRK